MFDELKHFSKEEFLAIVKRTHAPAIYAACVKELGDGHATSSQAIAALTCAIKSHGESATTSVSMAARDEAW